MLDSVLALDGFDARVFDNVGPTGPQNGAADYITVPDAHLLFNGDFKRVGTSGLKITGEDGKSFFIEDYFSGEKHKHLMSPEGAMLTANVVGALAGPLAPGQFAQAGAQPTAQPVIGRVDALSGSCTVVRNGVTVALNMGDGVRKGDVVQTSGSSAISIVFTDGSTFSLSANARMVLDEFVYSNGGTNNSAVINLVQGTFSFVAGQVAKTGDMRVDTPVATMGIRGTAVLVEISANDGQTKFSVMVEPNGTTGSFNLYNKTTGTLIATVNNSQVGWLVTPAGPLQVLAQQVNKTPAELQQELGIVQQLFTIFNNYQQNPIDPNQQQDPGRRGDNQNGPQNAGAMGSGGSGGAPTTGQQTNYNVTITQIPDNNGNSQNPPGPTNTGTGPNPNPNNPAGPDGGTTPIPLQTGTFTVINGSGIIVGTSGNDHIFGSTGNDQITALQGDDQVFGGDGDDILIAGHGEGNDFYDGGTGHDTIKFESATNGVTFHLNVGTITLPGGQVVKASTADGADIGHDDFVRVEEIVGSPGNDIFVLHDAGDWKIDAGAGIDIVRFAGGLDLHNTPGGPEITNFEIVDLKTDQTVDGNGISNVVHFDVSDFGSIGNTTPLRILGDSHDHISLGNMYGLHGTWTKTQDNVSDNFADGLTSGVVFDVYTWNFGGKTETVYVQDGIVINAVPVFDNPVVNVFGNFALTEFQGIESIKLTSGAIAQGQLENDLGLGPDAFEDLAEQANAVYPPGQSTPPDGPTAGSAVTFDFYLQLGESVHTQWLFDANDYLPYNDFAFVAVTRDGEVVQLINLLSSVDEVGNYNQTGWQQFSFSAQQEGLYKLSFGVMDEGDGILSSDLYVTPAHVTLAPMTEDIYTLPPPDEGEEGPPATPILTTSRTIAFSDPDLADVHTVTAEFLNASHLGIVDAQVVQGEGGPRVILNYSVDNAAVQYLAKGQMLYQDIKVTLSDGTDFAEQFFTVAIVGANDAPTITIGTNDSNNASLAETNAGRAANGTLTIADVDTTDQLTVSLVAADFDVDGRLGGLTETQLHDFMSVSRGATDGNGGKVNWVFNSGNNAFDYLADGEQLILHYVVRVNDGTASADQIVNITINGTNDAPIAQNSSAEGEVDDTINFTISAIDDSSSATFSFINPTAMLLKGEFSDDSFSTTLDAADLQNLLYEYRQDGVLSKSLQFRPYEDGTFSFDFSVTDVETQHSAIPGTITFDISNGAII